MAAAIRRASATRACTGRRARLRRRRGCVRRSRARCGSARGEGRRPSKTWVCRTASGAGTAGTSGTSAGGTPATGNWGTRCLSARATFAGLLRRHRLLLRRDLTGIPFTVRGRLAPASAPARSALDARCAEYKSRSIVSPDRGQTFVTEAIGERARILTRGSPTTCRGAARLAPGRARAGAARSRSTTRGRVRRRRAAATTLRDTRSRARPSARPQSRGPPRCAGPRQPRPARVGVARERKPVAVGSKPCQPTPGK